MTKEQLKQWAFDYHAKGRPGKVEVIPSKPVSKRDHLVAAYSPGVAEPCLAIQQDPANAYKYTSKRNLVAVISNGTAVLGLGDIGHQASKPVMEGKGLLFKIYADIDSYDIEIDSKDPDEIIRTVKLISDTFGGINLEDIKAPECFKIETELKKLCNIPVFHDDQHGTAVVSLAGIKNAIEIQGKKLENCKIVVNGAGASAISTAELLKFYGAKNVMLVDSKGVIYKGRKEGMNTQKEGFAVETSDRTLEDAARNADILIGLSVAGAFTEAIIKELAPNPIICACANPDPETTPDKVKAIRQDAIVATGRSDYNNQINNVLCFPFLFRGTLDTHSVEINMQMKVACAEALAELAKKPVPAEVIEAYGGDKIEFGKEYIIPKPADPRLLIELAMRVAKAAIDTGASPMKNFNFDEYRKELEERSKHLKRLITDADEHLNLFK